MNRYQSVFFLLFSLGHALIWLSDLTLSRAKLVSSPKTSGHDNVGGNAPRTKGSPAMVPGMRGREGWGLGLDICRLIILITWIIHLRYRLSFYRVL